MPYSDLGRTPPQVKCCRNFQFKSISYKSMGYILVEEYACGFLYKFNRTPVNNIIFEDTEQILTRWIPDIIICKH